MGIATTAGDTIAAAEATWTYQPLLSNRYGAAAGGAPTAGKPAKATLLV